MSETQEPVSKNVHKVSSPSQLAQLAAKWKADASIERQHVYVELLHPLTEPTLLTACRKPEDFLYDYEALDLTAVCNAWRKEWKDFPWSVVQTVTLDVFIPHSRKEEHTENFCCYSLYGWDSLDAPTVHIAYDEPPSRAKAEKNSKTVKAVCIRIDDILHLVHLLAIVVSMKSKRQSKCSLEFGDWQKSANAGYGRGKLFFDADAILTKLSVNGNESTQ